MTDKVFRSRPEALTVMLTQEEKDQIDLVATARGTDRSKVVREYIFKGLESDQPTVKAYLDRKQEQYRERGNPTTV